jgi:hypothetical protein
MSSVTPLRMVLCGVGVSALVDLLPWSYCMSGDAHGFPFPIAYPRHGEDFMTFGWVTGTEGGGVVVDLSAIPMNACIFVAIAGVIGFSYRLIARWIRAPRGP